MEKQYNNNRTEAASRTVDVGAQADGPGSVNVLLSLPSLWTRLTTARAMTFPFLLVSCLICVTDKDHFVLSFWLEDAILNCF